MENLMWDAVPTQRTKKQERYNFPAVTMVALDKPGVGRKFVFNKAAQELLGISGEDYISFGFSPDKSIIAVRKNDTIAGLKLTKTCTISDKKTYEFIAKILNLDTTKENSFRLETKNNLVVFNQNRLLDSELASIIDNEATTNESLEEFNRVMEEVTASENTSEEEVEDLTINSSSDDSDNFDDNQW
jgi:hypothetical protein